MDDRDLEERLRTHLHRRFDGAEPPPELLAAVQQVIATPPHRIGLPQLRAGTFRPGWSLVAVALGVAVIAIAGLRFGGLLGPGNDPTPSPTTPSPGWREFIVLSPSASEPSKAQIGLASEVLTARVRALGVGNYMAVTGNAIQLSIPSQGASDEAVRVVLGATGEVEFVPLPPEDYGEGGFTVEVGSPLPKDEPALFGWDGIASVEPSTDEQGRQTLLITLEPTARDAFAAYTASHTGEYFAIVIDGEVALLPVINEPIPGGEILISDGENDGRFMRTLAILAGGMLPESWARPVVPIVLPREQVVAATIAEYPTATLESADLDAILEGSRWRAVWILVLEGHFPGECVIGVPASDCPFATSMRVILDVGTGEFISSESPAE